MAKGMVKTAGIFCCAAVMLGTKMASGAGFQLYTEGSAEALGQAGALSAREDAVSNAWYNPAALAGFPQRELMLGNTSVDLDIEYSDNSRSVETDGDWCYVPHFYYVHPLSERLTASLALNVPYGLATEWPGNWLGNQLAIDTYVEAMYLTPAVSLQMTDRLALAAGFNVVRTSAEIRRSLLFSELELNADGYGVGYLLAAHYKPHEDWGVGLKFQSRVDMTLRGQAIYTNPGSFDTTPGVAGGPWLNLREDDAEGDLRLPATLTLGITNNSLQRWTFGCDIVWSEWSTYDELAFRFDSIPAAMYPAPGVTVPGEASTAKSWTDVFSYRFGAEYILTENWRLRGGYVYDQSPVKEETRAPEMPGSDRHMLMLGVGYETESWGVDLAYSYLMAKKADAGSTTVLPAQALAPEGEYETRAHLVSLSLSYRF